jgi:hypothetical protein
MISRSEMFRQRVRTEREVLSAINERYPTEKLHGLSQQSIISWRERNKEQDANGRLDLIFAELMRLSIGLRVDADTSRIVFDELINKNFIGENSIAQLIALLEKN